MHTVPQPPNRASYGISSAPAWTFWFNSLSGQPDSVISDKTADPRPCWQVKFRPNSCALFNEEILPFFPEIGGFPWRVRSRATCAVRRFGGFNPSWIGFFVGGYGKIEELWSALSGLNYFPVGMAEDTGSWQGDTNASVASTGGVAFEGGPLMQAIPLKISFSLVADGLQRGSKRDGTKRHHTEVARRQDVRTKAPGVAATHECGARRRANRLHIVLVELDTFFHETIHVWGFSKTAMSAYICPARIISDDEEIVGLDRRRNDGGNRSRTATATSRAV